MQEFIDNQLGTIFSIVLPFLILIPGTIAAAILNKRRNKFYKALSQKYNLTHLLKPQIDLMRTFRSRLFRYERTVKTEGVFEGKHLDHTFHIFKKTFYAQKPTLFNQGYPETFTVCSCKFKTTEFPHILLKSTRMPLYQESDLSDTKISLEQEYLKDFDLYCPQDYEIEALQIFTEPLLESIKTISSEFSIEFGGNQMYIYINKDILKTKNESDVGKIVTTLKEIIDKTDGLLIRLKDDFEALDLYFKR